MVGVLLEPKTVGGSIGCFQDFMVGVLVEPRTVGWSTG